MRYESTQINYSNNQSTIVNGSMSYDVTSYQQAGYNVYTGTQAVWPVEYGYYATTGSIGAQMLYEYRATTITSRNTFSYSSTYSTAWNTYSMSFAFQPYYNYSYHTIYKTQYSTLTNGLNKQLSALYTERNLSQFDNGVYARSYFSYISIFTKTLTTGTSYLTRSSTSATSYLTRSSTSRTEYETRESTSGYSGVSSSSSQSSGWL